MLCSMDVPKYVLMSSFRRPAIKHHKPRFDCDVFSVTFYEHLLNLTNNIFCVGSNSERCARFTFRPLSPVDKSGTVLGKNPD